NHAVELDVRAIQLSASRTLTRADAPYQSHALFAKEVAIVVIQVVQVRRGRVLQLVIAALESPRIGPMRGRRMVGAEEVVGAGDPLVQVFLHQPARDHAGLGDARQPGIAGPHVEGLFTQHVAHGAAQRSEGRVLEHLQLKFAVAIDEVGEGEKVQPVIALLIERSQQALVLIGFALQHLLRFHLAGGAEVLDQQRTHLPTVAHLLDHHPRKRGAVVIAGRGLKEVALLLNAGKLGVTLVDDQVHQGIPHVLRGDLANVLPLAPAFVIAERDFFGFNGAVESVEVKIADVIVIDADFRAPLFEQSDPITERPDLHYFSRHDYSSQYSVVGQFRRNWLTIEYQRPAIRLRVAGLQ